MRLIKLIAVVSLTQVATALKTRLNGWYVCSDLTFSDEGSTGDLVAECAMYNAPLCYPGICDASEASEKTIEIFVKRMLAVDGDIESATNVWVLQGGPGDSSTAMESLMIDLHQQLDGAVNVYTMDHRGTGRSTFLDCVAAQTMTTGSPEGSKIDPFEVPACAQDLQFKYGDLASFSVTSAATDLATFIADFTNGANTTVYGVSYGTALVERLIHLDPPTVTGYVVDSIATSSGAPADKFEYFSTWNIDFGDIGDRFLALCEHNNECAARFEPRGLQNTLQDVLAAFDNDPNSTCASLMNDVTSDLRYEPPSLILRGALSALLGRSTLRKLIPPVVYRLNRCTPEDAQVLTYFISILNAEIVYSSQDDAFYSPLLYYVIIFSEMWESPSPSIEEMRARFTDARISDSEVYMNTPLYCAFSKENSTVCKELNVSNYVGQGIIYEHDEYWNTSARIPAQASVLLLNGKLDPMTSYKYAEYLLEALDGDSKELITFEYSVHDTISSTALVVDGDHTCGLDLLVSPARVQPHCAV
ncbi:serine protease family S33, putative [Phytophthora infestans T30-4]|uniref:Serine protease family S33, putative n=1 Tax=Phytophthora infestans (strain T30-4) TaxID=403677 RepID=D0NHV9_PHYIT|nr:serine protease family S33, putative [Phytophthora infestans T30-4]EEY58834.1 serine protease family S33, putative [Phytophthora infestans T30-4]|eukprot:XP_002901307.1 serine protease family S33, putative [Phytophthora infestans T30-4]